MDAADAYARNGLVLVESVLSAEEVNTLRAASELRLCEALRQHIRRQQILDADRERIWYAELIEKDGGRYDCRHGMGAPPFADLLRPGGLADKLIPLLRHTQLLGEDAEVVQLGLIHAPSHESWAALSAHEPGGSDGAEGTQTWHTDGGKAKGLRALTVFLPLVDVTASNGATEFRLGSHSSESAAAVDSTERGTIILAPAGSAIAFDYQLLHRGLKNSSGHDRPMLYAIVGTPVYDEHGNKGVPSLVGGDSPLFSGLEAAPFRPFRLEPSACPRALAPLSGGLPEHDFATSTRARNAAHAVKVRGWLEEALAFGALEMAINQLLKVLEICDQAAPPIEFADFAGLDQLILDHGEEEQVQWRAPRGSASPQRGWAAAAAAGVAAPVAAAAAAAAAAWTWLPPHPRPGPLSGDAPLEGAGQCRQRRWLGAIPGAALLRGGTCLELFDRPLLARLPARLQRGPNRCRRCLATCLRTLGRGRAAARVALRFFKARKAQGGAPVSNGTSSATDDASELLFVLADVAGLMPTPKLHGSAVGVRLLESVVSFLRTGAAGAARSLLRRWLPEWLATWEGASHAAASAGRGSSAGHAALGELLLTAGRVPDHGEAIELTVAAAPDEPDIIRARRHVLARCLGAAWGAAWWWGRSLPRASGPCAATVRAAATLASHALFVGYCLPFSDEESASVDAAVAALAARSDAEVCALSRNVLGLLAAIGMYRQLGVALPGASAAVRRMPPVLLLARCVAEQCPCGYDLLAAHLLRPSARHELAARLPAVTQSPAAQSESVATFYNATLYPAWHAPETFGFLPCTIGERIRRQVAGFEWPHERLERHAVLIAGSGSGHQVAQLLTTYTQCDVTCLDLSANSLAYAEQQLTRCLPREIHRVTSLVADLSALPAGDAGHHASGDVERDGGGSASSGDAPAAWGRRFHLVCCIGVLHHVHAPPAALALLVRSSLLPGGLLQLATYSRLSVDTWRPRARALPHSAYPTWSTRQADCFGSRRRPSCALRASGSLGSRGRRRRGTGRRRRWLRRRRGCLLALTVRGILLRRRSARLALPSTGDGLHLARAAGYARGCWPVRQRLLPGCSHGPARTARLSEAGGMDAAQQIWRYGTLSKSATPTCLAGCTASMPVVHDRETSKTSKNDGRWLAYRYLTVVSCDGWGCAQTFTVV